LSKPFEDISVPNQDIDVTPTSFGARPEYDAQNMDEADHDEIPREGVSVSGSRTSLHIKMSPASSGAREYDVKAEEAWHPNLTDTMAYDGSRVSEEARAAGILKQLET
jgi:hypothetical protein